MIRVHDERTAVTPLTEGAIVSAFDFDLIVEAEISDVVSHYHVVKFKGGDAPAGVFACSADFFHRRVEVEHGWRQARELTEVADHAALEDEA